MANHKTGAQRYNDKMDKVYKNAILELQKHCKHTKYHSTELPATVDTITNTCDTCGLIFTHNTPNAQTISKLSEGKRLESIAYIEATIFLIQSVKVVRVEKLQLVTALNDIRHLLMTIDDIPY